MILDLPLLSGDFKFDTAQAMGWPSAARAGAAHMETIVNKRLSRCTVGAWLVSALGTAYAFPQAPVTVVVPFGAGTSVDAHGRDFALALGGVVKESVIVDNRAGAEGAIGALAVLRAKADGHTLMFTSSSIPVLDPIVKKSMQFDPLKDFTPICTVGRTSNVLNVTGSSPIKTAAEFISTAKAQPGKLTFAYASATTRLAGELFQQAAGIQLTGVPYKASANGLTDTASGLVDAFFIDDISVGGFYASGKIRALAVSGPNRIRALPDTPSANEVGVPNYTIQPWFGVYVSSKTPPAVVTQLRELMGQAMKSPAAVAQSEKRGLVPLIVCGDAMHKLQMEEIELWRGVVKKAGIEPQ